MQTHQRRSGLLVAEQAVAPKDIAELLRRHDPQLELRSQVDPDWECFVWRVFVHHSDGRNTWLLDWREDLTDGNSRPRPLSSALVDEVASYQQGSRRPLVDPLQANDELQAREQREDVEDTLTLAAEAERTGRRSSVFHRSRGLYLSRARARARGERA